MPQPSRPDDQKRYDVLLYPVVLLNVPGVVAKSHREAVEKACAEIAPELCEKFTPCGAEYADEFSHFVVDVVGDEEFRQSRSFYSQSEPLVSNLARLVLWYDQADRDMAELERIIADARNVIETSI